MAEQPHIREAHVADYTLRVGDLTRDELRVVSFEGVEAISELYMFRIVCVADQVDISTDSVLGKPAVLWIATATSVRHVNGVIRRFVRAGEGHTLGHYELELVPSHWLLTRRFKSRIFQEHNCPDMSVPGILKKVFLDAGLPEDRFRFALERTYKPQEYVVQYRESDMNFAARLMEEEGIFFFFEHTNTSHKMVIADSGVAHVEAEDAAQIPFRAPSGLVPEEEHVFSAVDEQDIVHSAVALDAFNFEKPALELAGAATGEETTALEFSDFPGDYYEQAVGQVRAERTLEGFQCRKRTIRMVATARGLLPGFKFTLTDFSSSDLNREYVVTRIEHSGVQSQSGEAETLDGPQRPYTARIAAIFSNVPFRPARITPRPVVLGTQTAIVAGPAGEEIYTDKYGRVKVQFHWDREGRHDENSSRWIRVSHGSAGGQYGMMFLPRIGQEVIVDFLNGDPDRPIIVGRVYNGDHMPPYALPDEKTKSTIKTNSSKGGGGTNEIRFEDLKGEEQLLLNAEKDFHLRAKNCSVETIGGSRSVGVGGSQATKIGQNRSLKIECDDAVEVGAKRSLTVCGNLIEKIGDDHAEEVGGERFMKAMTVIIEAGMGITLKGPGGFIKIDPAGVTIQGNLVLINSGGAAMSSGITDPADEPKDPSSADKVKPGQDTRYTAAGLTDTPAEIEELPEHRTFVEFQLLEPGGDPVADEPYVVRLPDGSEQTGNTDAEGKCRFEEIEPGSARISFPQRENNEWRRVRVDSEETE